MESATSVAATDTSGATPPVYAGLWIRFGAFLLDYLGSVVVSLVLALVLGLVIVFVVAFVLALRGQTFDPKPFGSIFGFAIAVPVGWCYFALFEASKYQGTPGKLALGLRVTDEAGQRITFGRATTRYFSKFLSSILLGAGYIMVAINPRKQGLHDRIAHTLVVRTR